MPWQDKVFLLPNRMTNGLKPKSTEEYSSKSELVNDLIRQAREQQKQIDWIRAKLIKAEKSGFTSMSSKEILAQSKQELGKP